MPTDDVQKHVARLPALLCCSDGAETCWDFACRQLQCAFGPCVDFTWRIARFRIRRSPHDPDINKRRREIRNLGKLRVRGDNSRHLTRAEQLDEFGRAEALMPDLDGVP